MFFIALGMFSRTNACAFIISRTLSQSITETVLTSSQQTSQSYNSTSSFSQLTLTLISHTTKVLKLLKIKIKC